MEEERAKGKMHFLASADQNFSSSEAFEPPSLPVGLHRCHLTSPEPLHNVTGGRGERWEGYPHIGGTVVVPQIFDEVSQGPPRTREAHNHFSLSFGSSGGPNVLPVVVEGKWKANRTYGVVHERPEEEW